MRGGSWGKIPFVWHLIEFSRGFFPPFFLFFNIILLAMELYFQIELFCRKNACMYFLLFPFFSRIYHLKRAFFGWVIYFLCSSLHFPPPHKISFCTFLFTNSSLTGLCCRNKQDRTKRFQCCLKYYRRFRNRKRNENK